MVHQQSTPCALIRATHAITRPHILVSVLALVQDEAPKRLAARTSVVACSRNSQHGRT